MFRSMLAVCLLFSVNIAAQQQKVKEPEFPTTEEIQLVVTQSEEAFHQYEQSVSLEAGLVSRKNDTTSDKDRQIVEMSAKLISGLRKKPEVSRWFASALHIGRCIEKCRTLCERRDDPDSTGSLVEARCHCHLPNHDHRPKLRGYFSTPIHRQRIGACTLREVD